MRRWILAILSVGLAFAIGLGVGYRRGFNQPKSDESALLAKGLSPPEKERSYERGPAGSATEGSFITLNSSDGMSFVRWTNDYENAEQARAEFERRVKEASEVVRREPFYDEYGRNIGEKAVVKFDASKRIGPASLLWTDREILCRVDSSSVQNILEYRKDFHR